MALKYLQANINHCARAQDLLLQSMAEWLIHVTVIAEPYIVPPRDDWTGDREGLVAITTQGSANSSPFEKVAKGRGCVAVLLGKIVTIGVYFSPNKTLAEFEAYLSEVDALLRWSGPHQVLVIGDLNAKSVAWGSPSTDARGAILEEWVVAAGLSILNRGSVDTCVRRHGGSIVDITFASPALARQTQNWKVLESVETLSDHRYIRFDVSTLPERQSGLSRNSRMDEPRWVLKRLDRDALVEASVVAAWLPSPDGTMEIDERTAWFCRAVSQVCDASMPRAKPLPPRRQVYWWSAEIAHRRDACVAARRQYTRQRRRRIRNQEEEDRLYALYREAITGLQIAIGDAKASAWDEMLETLNNDPWGRPYKMVRKKLRPWAPPLTRSLQPQFLERVVTTLFPDTGAHICPSMAATIEEEEGDVPAITEGEMYAGVLRLRSKNTAPGPDGIPGRVLVLALEAALEPRLRGLLDTCLEQGRFPRKWKSGKLVLLRKEGRPAESPSAYRPIVLLDKVGKLFERIIANRLIEHLERTGPDLADTQFGFRRGRSTIDAISRVRQLTEEAIAIGGVVLAVSLDIANAFNTLPWSCVNEALRYHRVPLYLRQIVASYLSDRYITYPGREEWCRREMSCGVPQGSVLGPLLWNIGYDWVLRGATLNGVAITCYADDTLVTASGKSYREAAVLATAGVAQVVARIRRLGLQVALNKSEAMCFHGPRNVSPAGAQIVVGGVSIHVKSTMRYLGVVLDSRWTFKEHFKRLSPKLIGAAAALSRLLPNLGGPNVACRRLYAGVVRSMALYGAPIWVDSLAAHNKTLLRRPQRVMAVRIIRGYRTISFEAACVMAGTPPWELDAEMLAGVYWQRWDYRRQGQWPTLEEAKRQQEAARKTLIRKWKERIAEPSAGRRTIEAIRPVLQQWVDREHGSLSFRLAQILSGHGCFGRYLCNVVGREPTTTCHHCGCAEDTAQHTVAECSAWAEERAVMASVVGSDLSLPAVVKAMVRSDGAWKAVATFCGAVQGAKETAERMREDDVLSHPIRRRRIGRRRQAHVRRMPP